jgi:hypothetical protein
MCSFAGADTRETLTEMRSFMAVFESKLAMIDLASWYRSFQLSRFVHSL